MNFVKFFSTESKLTDFRLHTYFIWVVTHFEAWDLGIVSVRRRAADTNPLFTDDPLHVSGILFTDDPLHVFTFKSTI